MKPEQAKSDYLRRLELREFLRVVKNFRDRGQAFDAHLDLRTGAVNVCWAPGQKRYLRSLLAKIGRNTL
jgi:hypothetical protein